MQAVPIYSDLQDNFATFVTMRTIKKNTLKIDEDKMNENILHSMIASFKIEKINISEKTAHEIYRRVRKRLKKEVL